MSANWARGHPWAAVYDFFAERETLSRPVAWALFGTDTRLMYRSMRAVDEVPRGGAVLDIPCGGGVALRAIRPEHEFRYVAADISQDMLERTEEVARSRGLGPIVETSREDAGDLSFDDGSFDLVLSLTGLHCFPEPDVACREMARVLKPGGVLVGSAFLTDGGIRYAPMVAAGRLIGVMGPSGGRDDLHRWLRDAGLSDIEIERSGALAYFRARR